MLKRIKREQDERKAQERANDRRRTQKQQDTILTMMVNVNQALQHLR